VSGEFDIITQRTCLQATSFGEEDNVEIFVTESQSGAVLRLLAVVKSIATGGGVLPEFLHNQIVPSLCVGDCHVDCVGSLSSGWLYRYLLMLS
jgi:hypothetical protein